MNPFTRNFRFWLPVLLWLGVIAYESLRLSSHVTGTYLWTFFRWLHLSISPTAFAELHHVLRKVGHVTGYGILCLLTFRAWFHTLDGAVLKALRLRCAVLALSLTLITAVLDEWHQNIDPARTSSVWDVGLDMTGGLAFLMVALFVFRIWRNRAVEELEPVSV